MACKRSWVRSPSTPPIIRLALVLALTWGALGFADDRQLWSKVSPPEFVYDRHLGFQHNPGQDVRHIEGTGDRQIWDVILSFDKYGHRKTPQANISDRKKFLVFYGCSFTLGTGLQNDETLPSYIAPKIPTHHVYNVSIGASGTNMLLAKIQDDRLREAITEAEGTLVYIPIDSHINRANLFLEESRWIKDAPIYKKLDNGEMTRLGSGADVYPFRLWIFDKLRALRDRFLPGRQFEFPFMMPWHIRYACDLTIQAEKDFKRRFPNSTFVVAIHPMAKLKKYSKCLAAAGIKLIHTPYAHLPEYSIPVDGHPSAQFNRIYAEQLADQLKPYLNLTSISSPIKAEVSPVSTGPRGTTKR